MANKESFLIGVTGGSGSGKTTFIRNLRSEFTEEELGLISMDNYYKPRQQQVKDEAGELNFDLPSSFIWVDFFKDLAKAKQAQEIRRMEYTFNNPLAVAQEIVVPPAKVYLIEGLFLLHDELLRNLLDLKVLIHADDVYKVIRRIKRDQTERNYPLEDVLYKYEKHVSPSYKAYVEPYLSYLDIIVYNNRHFNNALDMFKAFIREKQAKS
ncbi:MAG TPA: uridine kinase [Saprospiraceae bacterium]|nr:uridine kinase [Saprospiraceae bacterium]